MAHGHQRIDRETQTRPTTTTTTRGDGLMRYLFYPQVGNFTLALLGSFNLALTGAAFELLSHPTVHVRPQLLGPAREALR